MFPSVPTQADTRGGTAVIIEDFTTQGFDLSTEKALAVCVYICLLNSEMCYHAVTKLLFTLEEKGRNSIGRV